MKDSKVITLPGRNNRLERFVEGLDDYVTNNCEGLSYLEIVGALELMKHYVLTDATSEDEGYETH